MATTSDSRGRRARLRLRTLARWLSYYETSPVSHDESLLRAIPNTPAHLSDDMGNWKIAPYAFQPNKNRDIDGMSFFREDFSTPKQIAKTNKHGSGARVASITVEQLESLELTATPGPIASEPAGHSIVPGMRFVEKSLLSTEQRREVKDRSQKLAQFASSNRIYSPPGLPGPGGKL